MYSVLWHLQDEVSPQQLESHLLHRRDTDAALATSRQSARNLRRDQQHLSWLFDQERVLFVILLLVTLKQFFVQNINQDYKQYNPNYVFSFIYE